MTKGVKTVDASDDVKFVNDGVVSPSKGSSIVASLEDVHSVAGEELRLLRSRVRELGQSGRFSCYGLTSAVPGEGKSTVALGLAAALARDPGRRVLLIEADLRRPSIAECLGLPPASGLREWLNGGRPGAVPVRRLDPGGFTVLVAGEVPLERPESLGSPQMDRLFRASRSAYDDVIVDTPPILPVADTISMQDLLDGFLLVVRSRSTPREAILDALRRVRPEKVVGVILNDHREYRNSYSQYAYDRYGMTYGPRAHSGRERAR